MTAQYSVDELNHLRYPVGRFSAPGSGPEAVRAGHIQSLRLLPERLSSAVADLDDSQLDTPYRDGGWTIRQVVHHVADSHGNAFNRMKLALTEEWPVIKPYDEAAWANLADSQLSVGVSLEFIAALHVRWVSLLESLEDQDFSKGYVHPAMLKNGGKQSLDEMLALYEWHGRHHTAHVLNLRQRMGW